MDLYSIVTVVYSLVSSDSDNSSDINDLYSIVTVVRSDDSSNNSSDINDL